jgi:hypothetical protein
VAHLSALKLLGKKVGLFKPKEVPEVARSAKDIKSSVELKLAALID